MGKMRVLISRPDRLGDVILSTGIPREIKKSFPDSFVAVLLRPYTADIYKNNPFVDAVIIYDPDDPAFEYSQKVKEIREYRFSHGLMLLPNKKINYMLFQAGIPRRYGSGHKFYQFITGARTVSRHKYVPLRHEADYCMDLARRIGVKTRNIDSEIHLSEEEKKKAAQIRESLAGNGRILIGIHSTSGMSAPNWRPERYRELAEKLLMHNEIKIVVTDDNPPEVMRNIEGVIYINEKQKLRESIVNFSVLDCLVSASTGPMHIAAALRVRTVSLFCPLFNCSPQLWGPKGNDSVIIMPEGESCIPDCDKNTSMCRFEKGKSNIPVERVYQEILKNCRIK